MAIVEARDKDKLEKMKKGVMGAGGGVAPEGYSNVFLTGFTASVGEEGVSTRSKEEEDKRFAEAKKFEDSIRKVDKDGVDEIKVEKARQKEAEAKPTAPNAQTETLAQGKGQPAAATEKEELADAKLAEGDVAGAEKAKKEAEAAKKGK